MVEGRGAAADAFERAVVDLARKSVHAPKRLTPYDLEPLTAARGDDAVCYALVLGAFHFINRIADLLDVDSEALPPWLRRFETLRRVSVSIAARLFRGVDLRNRRYDRTYEEALTAFGELLERGFGQPPGEKLARLRRRPQIIEMLALAVEERETRSTLDANLIARVQRGVEAALPQRREEAAGFDARPSDPVDAFVFVGTRYPARATAAMIAALRSDGFDDLGILDLAIAVADANQWARTHRLLGLDPGLLCVRAAL